MFDTCVAGGLTNIKVACAKTPNLRTSIPESHKRLTYAEVEPLIRSSTVNDDLSRSNIRAVIHVT